MTSDKPPPNRRVAPPRVTDEGREGRARAERKNSPSARPEPSRRASRPSEDESPLPGAATTTTLRPPASAARARAAGMWRALQLLAGVIVVIAASSAVAWGARRYITTSPRFSVRTVLVDGVHRRGATQVAAAGGVEVGKNIFALDLTNVSALIEQDPWIEKATVTRKLPATISIAIVEREAHAIAAISGDLYLLTRDGDPFKKLAESDPNDLPIITGMTAEQVARDRAGVVIAFRRALDVLEDLGRAGIDRRFPIQEMHLDKDGTLVVTIGKDAIALHFGASPYRDKVERAIRILNEVARRKADASVIFLDNDAHPERVVVRMR